MQAVLCQLALVPTDSPGVFPLMFIGTELCLIHDHKQTGQAWACFHTEGIYKGLYIICVLAYFPVSLSVLGAVERVTFLAAIGLYLLSDGLEVMLGNTSVGCGFA